VQQYLYQPGAAGTARAVRGGAPLRQPTAAHDRDAGRRVFRTWRPATHRSGAATATAPCTI